MIGPYISGQTVPKLTNADVDNITTESVLYNRFKLLAINKFEWAGLPETIPERFLENGLYTEGQMFFFVDKELGPLCLPCYGLGTPNVYGEYLRYHVAGFNYSKDVKASDGVLIENNKLRLPTLPIVNYFVEQLYHIKRTRDVNIAQLKYQFVIATKENNELSVKRLVEKVDNYEPIIITDKNAMDLDDMIKVLPTGVKPMLAELTDTYHDVLNECLTYLGINNANTDKRERLITNEVDANNQFIECCTSLFLESRQRACEEINKKLGLNISVRERVEEVDVNAVELDTQSTTKNDKTDNS